MTSETVSKAGRPVNSPRQVLFASLIGTTIEFFDFYIYATAAVLVFPRLFFPASDPASATLASLATFAIAFLARPIGSALFGHFGDRRCCSRSADSARDLDWAVNGAARCSSRSKTRHRASAPGMECFRSSARRLASSSLAACSWLCHAC